MINKKKIEFGILSAVVLLLVVIVGVGFVSAQYSSSFFSSSAGSSFSSVRTQYSQPNYRTYYSSNEMRDYWPILNNPEECFARQDFIVQIAPGGCQPAVVRSDLLEEQNIPVFCQLDAIKLNPLIDIEVVENVNFEGEYSPEVAGVGFHPAQAALRTRNRLLGSPILNNIGYAVILLKGGRGIIEKDMPEYVEGNLTAYLRYDLKNTLGVGRAEFYLPQMTDEEWEQNYMQYSFWQGKGYIRLEKIDSERAVIGIYTDAHNKIKTLVVERGKTSKEIYLPGYYCMAGLRLSFTGLELPEKKATVYVDDNLYELYEGSKFFDDACRVTKIRIGEEIERREGSGVSEVYRGRYEKYRNLFEKYDENPPEGFSKIEFRALLVAIAQKETSLGENNPRNLLMGYGDGGNERGFIGHENQVKSASETLREAFNNQNNLYSSCNDKQNLDDKKECILSIYNQGIQNNDGKKYAKKVIEYSEDWEEEFSGIISTIGDINEANVEFVCQRDRFTLNLGGKAIRKGKYYTGAIEDYKKVSEQCSSEKEEKLDSETIGEKAERGIEDLTNYMQGAGHTFEINGELHTIRLINVDKPKDEDSGVVVNTDANVLQKGEYVWRKEDNSGYIRLKNYDETSAEFEYDCDEEKGRDTMKILEGQSGIMCNQDVYVRQINLERLAKVRLIPKTYDVQSAANFSFKIGIEKRAIDLSPEKTEEMIDNIEENIEKWEGINNKLGKTVKTMKSACFATSGFLTIKSLFDNFNGRSIARKKVMRDSGGWMEKCENNDEDLSVDACLLKYSDNIDKDVDAMQKIIEEQNTRIRNLEKESGMVVSESWLGDKIINTDLSGKKNLEYLYNNYQSNDINFECGEGKETKKVSDIFTNIKIDDDEEINSWSKGDINYDQMNSIERNIMILEDSSSSEVMKEIAEKELCEEYGYLSVLTEGQDEVYALAQDFGLNPSQVPFYNVGQNTEVQPYEDLTWANVKNKINDIDGSIQDKTPVQIFRTAAGKKYLYVLEQEGDKYSASSGNRYILTKNNENYHARQDNNAPDLYFQKFDLSSYQNKMTKKEIKFYETAPYKGMPALVPFDSTNGWYAATQQTLPGFGNIKSFESSGAVSSFWLCNVGENRIAQFNQGFGDDICRQFNINAQPIEGFPGLDDAKTRKLVRCAQDALRQAAQKYANGVKKIRISTSCAREETINVGMPMTSIPGTQCQDFMSPKDCHILFNVCDPVICPSSRCNLGGQYPVDNVVQQGIIGGAVLCLPNYKEKIFVPFCLTGIHAGIENYISILQASRDCLQESLETGRNIGICDEIKSIYLCEFFWRQISPVMNILIPKALERVGGKGTRGGGEYLSVMDAWQNMQETVNYLTQEYAVESMKQFRIRSTEQVGSTVCKSFISTRYPTDIGTFIEPDSPTQFHAWFSEIPHTDATLPATSQYKTYYHIFAGNDQGVHYSIYLKNPPESSYYAQGVSMVVATGYAPRGEYVSETIDRTGPAGYKELCVRINAQEECGFKQVASSFALNYARDMYIDEQAEERNIKSTKDCVSGTPSLLAAVQPNPESALQEAALPEIYKRGLIRVCSTKDPGEGVEPERWIKVGYCDDNKVSCWLDRNSVQDAMTAENKGLINATLEEMKKTQDEMAKYRENKDMIENKLSEIDNKISDLETGAKNSKNDIAEDAMDLMAEIHKVRQESVWANQKCQIDLRKAQVQDIVARSEYDKKREEEVEEDGEGICINNPNEKKCNSDDDCYWYDNNCRECDKENIGEINNNYQCIVFCENCGGGCKWDRKKEECVATTIAV